MQRVLNNEGGIDMNTKMMLNGVLLVCGLAWSYPGPHGNSQRHLRKALRADTLAAPTAGQLESVLRLGNRKCPVDGHAIDSAAVLVIRKNLLVSLSSEACRKEFAKDPDGYTRQALKIVGQELP
jgi:hypothetical protein